MELLTEPVNPKVEGMDGRGWSNSPAEPDPVHVSVYPEVAPPEEFVPGSSNSLAVVAEHDAYGLPDIPPAGDAPSDDPTPAPGETNTDPEPEPTVEPPATPEPVSEPVVEEPPAEPAVTPEA